MDADGRPLHSWRTLILPYLDQETLNRTIDLSKPWDDPVNAEAKRTVVSSYQCPEGYGSPPNTTTFLVIMGPDGCFPNGASRRLAEVTDAHESTLMVIEVDERYAVPWMAPIDADVSLFMSLESTSKLHHRGGMNVGFLDGHMGFMNIHAEPDARRAAITIAGGDDEVADGL